MIPYIYTTNEYLPDATMCEIRESIGGECELVMNYPCNGKNWDLLVDNVLIGIAYKANEDGELEHEAFRVYRITQPIGHVFTVYARHISYDAVQAFIAPPKLGEAEHRATNAAEAAELINGLITIYSEPRLVLADEPTSGEFVMPSTPTNFRQAIFDEEWGFLATYGGEIEARGLKFIWHKDSIGKDRPLTISYGYNLAEFSQDISFDGRPQFIFPYAVHPDLGYFDASAYAYNSDFLWQGLIGNNPSAIKVPEQYIRVENMNLTDKIRESLKTRNGQTVLQRSGGVLFAMDNDPSGAVLKNQTGETVSADSYGLKQNYFFADESGQEVSELEDKKIYTVQKHRTNPHAIDVHPGYGGGAKEVNKTVADAGEIVKIIVSPDDGYVIESVIAALYDGATQIEITKHYRDRYTFVMPDADVLVLVSFKESPQTLIMEPDPPQYTAEIDMLDGSDPIKYATLPEAIAVAEAESKYVTINLLADIVLDAPLQISARTATLNLNGYSIISSVEAIRFSGDAYTYVVDYGGAGRSRISTTSLDLPAISIGGSAIVSAQDILIEAYYGPAVKTEDKGSIVLSGGMLFTEGAVVVDHGADTIMVVGGALVETGNDHHKTLIDTAWQHYFNNRETYESPGIDISVVPAMITGGDFEILQDHKLNLGDTVTLVFQRWGTSAKIRCVERVFDVLTERIKRMQLGSPKKTIIAPLAKNMKRSK